MCRCAHTRQKEIQLINKKDDLEVSLHANGS